MHLGCSVILYWHLLPSQNCRPKPRVVLVLFSSWKPRLNSLSISSAKAAWWSVWQYECPSAAEERLVDFKLSGKLKQLSNARKEPRAMFPFFPCGGKSPTFFSPSRSPLPFLKTARISTF